MSNLFALTDVQHSSSTTRTQQNTRVHYSKPHHVYLDEAERLEEKLKSLNFR